MRLGQTFGDEKAKAETAPGALLRDAALLEGIEDQGRSVGSILDNASWHKAARLRWHHFEVRFLPAYSPDFNPIERLWLRLKADYFTDWIARTPDELTERLCMALNALMDDPPKVAAQCATRK